MLRSLVVDADGGGGNSSSSRHACTLPLAWIESAPSQSGAISQRRALLRFCVYKLPSLDSNFRRPRHYTPGWEVFVCSYVVVIHEKRHNASHVMFHQRLT